MFKEEKINIQDKKIFYERLNICLQGLISEESYWLAGISNASALLYMMLSEINWSGFYLYKEGQLVLGPFQGKPACVRILIGKGVCGRSAELRRTLVVEDVNQFPGHIACDTVSQSEIVIPIIKYDRLIGVLDIDSPIKARFDDKDAKGLNDFVHILNRYIQWPEQL